MSDTPRTDEATKTTDWATGEPVVTSDFARKLERENALLSAANSDVKRIAMERDRLHKSLVDLEDLSRNHTTTRQLLRNRIQAILANGPDQLSGAPTKTQNEH